MRNLAARTPSLPHFFERNRRQRGSAVVEVSLLAPWILFLFVGMFDMGMYTYSMIGVENAARVAAEYTSQNTSVAADKDGACTRAMAEMAMLPNVSSQANCDSGGATRSWSPLPLSAPRRCLLRWTASPPPRFRSPTPATSWSRSPAC